MSPKTTASRYGFKPMSCAIRRTKPRGPMYGCQDCPKLDECVELTLELREDPLCA